MKLVALDTAGPVIGLGLWHDGVVRTRTERVGRGAEARLMPWLAELCAEAGFSVSALDAVAVTAGPGAFTGLRVGLATAQGLSFALQRPLWATDSLRPRALAAGHLGLPVLVMLDARKARVYSALYDGDERVRPPADLPPEAALEGIEAPFLATGEGALVYRGLVEAAGGQVFEHAADPAISALLSLAQLGLSAGEGRAPEAVAPLYLREPDAVPSAG